MAHAFAGGTSAICRCPHDPGRAALVSRPRHRLRVLASSLPTPAIEGQGVELSVTTRRGRVLPVLKDCSLRVPPGQLWMLLGPNGCGKSTLLKVVMPTVESDVAFGLGKLNLSLDEVRSRVSQSLDAVGMLSYSQRPIQTLSGGQKQRVAIAGALAEASKVLLLDELTTFLDEYDQMGVIKAVRKSVGAGGEVSALWVTHRLEELRYADGAIYMEDGQTIIQGDVSTISKYIKKKQARYFGHFEL
ncbi:ABC transporter I family member 10 isoform X2 [Oryza sativa Japonica Group]|uniref:ABC transporter I family member 10 isoform X2 n=1 Tax=Oryza sativa subsp. japonica TaxID=39947 RepID=UPI00339D2630